MKRIILDTDLAMGAGDDIDDGFALALALAEPELSVDLITTVSGATDAESSGFLALELMTRLGRAKVPVVVGARAPFTRPDLRQSALPEILETYGHHHPESGWAPVAILEHLRAHPGEITIVAIGPLTNLAMAINLEPNFAELVDEIVVMGGVFRGQTGYVEMPGEFNVWRDPESAQAVLASGARQRWVGLDVTMQVRLRREMAQRMAGSGSAFLSYAGQAALTWMDVMGARNPGDPTLSQWCAMHDPLAVAAVSRPDLLRFVDSHVRVVTGESAARGLTLADSLIDVEAPPANCKVAAEVDAEGFLEYFLDRVSPY